MSKTQWNEDMDKILRTMEMHNMLEQAPLRFCCSAEEIKERLEQIKEGIEATERLEKQEKALARADEVHENKLKEAKKIQEVSEIQMVENQKPMNGMEIIFTDMCKQYDVLGKHLEQTANVLWRQPDAETILKEICDPVFDNARIVLDVICNIQKKYIIIEKPIIQIQEQDAEDGINGG